MMKIMSTDRTRKVERTKPSEHVHHGYQFGNHSETLQFHSAFVFIIYKPKENNSNKSLCIYQWIVLNYDPEQNNLNSKKKQALR